MDLSQALRLTPPPLLKGATNLFSTPARSSDGIAFVGAGGKSSAMFQLAHLLSGRGKAPVIVTATAHLHIDQFKYAASLWFAKNPASLSKLEENLQGIILVTGPMEGDRTTGLDPESMEWLHQLCGYHDIPLLIEADGSRRHALKAPAEHEPPIPKFAGTVVVVAGLSAMGKPLDSETVHRPEIFSGLSQLRQGAAITPNALLHVLTHASGGLKNIPEGARRVALLTQASTPELQSSAGWLAERLIPVYDEVITCNFAAGIAVGRTTIRSAIEPTAGIILAAGESSRFGSPKQLLDYHGETFIRHIARTALSASLSPVIVVTGANAEAVEAPLENLPVQVVRNEAWQDGQGSSIRAGVGALPANTGAAVFLLVDQPQMTTTVIRALVDRHASDFYPVVAPMIGDKRANPTLFDRLTFRHLLQLSGDIGGRAIFSKFPPTYLPWHDESLLLDVDSPDDLQKVRGLE